MSQDFTIDLPGPVASPDDTATSARGDAPVGNPDIGHWLDKFCMELGYNNLTFISSYGSGCPLPDAVTLKGDDNADGIVGVKGFNFIKAVIVVILDYLIDMKLKELCYGCEVNHPSQIQHTCLYDPDKYFLYTHFEEISCKLFKLMLNQVIGQALKPLGLTPHPQRIYGVVGGVLCELREELHILQRLREIREKLVNDSGEQAVYDAVDRWKCCSAGSLF